MSKIAFSPSESGTGTLTIAAPNTNEDRTITLPDANVQIASPRGLFYKDTPDAVAWSKTGAFTVETATNLEVEVNRIVFLIPSGTAVTMPVSPVIGQDYTIWLNVDGSLEATTDHEAGPAITSRKLGGFHYAPNDNATLDANGNWANHTGAPTTAVPQINALSFWDLKWKPGGRDPRGLSLCPIAQVWAGMYPMNNGNVAGKPIHSYGVAPCRDGNPPFKRWADTPVAYPDAKPINILELLRSEGLRPMTADLFQILALGTTEQVSAGGSNPGNTGEQGTAQNKNRFVSAWGLFDITGVISAWGADSLPDNTQAAGVTQGRSNDIFRVSRFANFGGNWNSTATSGSRFVNADEASGSRSGIGGRGVTNHIVIP